MRGAYVQFIRTKGTSLYTAAVERAHNLRKEEAELRLARIFNKAEPEMQNGKPPVWKKKEGKPMNKS
jgi:hypothetical protein